MKGSLLEMSAPCETASVVVAALPSVDEGHHGPQVDGRSARGWCRTLDDLMLAIPVDVGSGGRLAKRVVFNAQLAFSEVDGSP